MCVTVVIMKLCPCTCIAVLLNDPRQNMENSTKHGESGTRPEISKHGSKTLITAQILLIFDH